MAPTNEMTQFHGSSLFTVGKAQPSGGAGLAFTALRAASGKEKGPEAMGALPAV